MDRDEPAAVVVAPRPKVVGLHVIWHAVPAWLKARGRRMPESMPQGMIGGFVRSQDLKGMGVWGKGVADAKALFQMPESMPLGMIGGFGRQT